VLARPQRLEGGVDGGEVLLQAVVLKFVLPLLLRRSSSPSERRDDTLRIRRMPRMRIRRQLQHENSEKLFGHWYCTHNQRIY
jgi:hypothetical protein